MTIHNKLSQRQMQYSGTLLALMVSPHLQPLDLHMSSLGFQCLTCSHINSIFYIETLRHVATGAMDSKCQDHSCAFM